MVNVISLWLPILLSALFVFMVSSIIHMFLPYHRSDFKKIQSEDEVMDSLRKFNILPGDYVMPYAGSPEVMRSEEYKEKVRNGPMAFMTVMKSGEQNMGANLALWFVYSVVVGIFAAYITGLALGPGSEYMIVFRFASATAFIGYSLALLQNSIWYKRNWPATIKSMFDGLIYALVTGGVFGWLWPGI
jgi:hypothetical protein